MLPFETVIALLLLISGSAQLGRWGRADPTLLVLPAWEAMSLNILAIVSGIFILAGIARSSKRFELAGLFFLMAVVTVRLLLYAEFIGIDEEFLVMGVFYATILWASIARIVTLARGRTLMWVRGEHDLRS